MARTTQAGCEQDCWTSIITRKIVIRDDAFSDLDHSSATLFEYSPKASARFLEEALNAFRLLADMPGLGTPRDFDNPSLRGMRMWPVSRFRKYLIFYLSTGTTIEVVRVLHSSRNIEAVFRSPEGS